MESIQYKIIRNFIDEQSRLDIIQYVDSINEEILITNPHLSYLVNKLNGSSFMYDISKTPETGVITRFQSGGRVVDKELPKSITVLIEKISKELGISPCNSFLQIVDMRNGGTIGKHYDASIKGFVNYKCNISVLSEPYIFCIENESLGINQSDLYAFEASLYKHWTLKQFTSRRILLSFGFLLPYGDLGRADNDPRIRLSQRIEKYFQTN